MSILINKLSNDFTLEDLDNLDRKEKDATNFLAINTNSIGMMTFERQLSFKSVTRFMQPINEIVGTRFRTLVQVLQTNAQNQGVQDAQSQSVRIQTIPKCGTNIEMHKIKVYKIKLYPSIATMSCFPNLSFVPCQ